MKTIVALLFVALFFQKTPVIAQSPSQRLHQFDGLIDRYFETEKTDSFLYFTNKKIAAARSLDSLAVWAWTKRRQHSHFFENNQKALGILREVGAEKWREPASPAEWAPFLQVECGIGWHLFRLGRVWESIEAYQRAEAIYDRFKYPDFDPTQFIYKPMGAKFVRLGDNEKALLIYQKALDFTQKTGDKNSLSGIYVNIGIAQWNMGDLAAAELTFKKGLQIKPLEAAKRALLLNGLAIVQLDLGQPGAAFSYAKNALALLKNIPENDQQLHEYRAGSNHIAGRARLKMGQPDEAGAFLKKALADAEAAFGKGVHRDKAKIETSISAAFLQKKQPADALASANRALGFLLPDFRPARPEGLPGPAGFYQENAIAEALHAKADAGEALFFEKNELKYLILSLDCRDLAWTANEQLRRVLLYQSSKLNIQQSARGLEERAMQAARTLFEKTGDPAFAERGLAIAERSKAAILSDALRENLFRQGIAGSDPRYGRLDKLRQNAAFLERGLLLEPAQPGAANLRLELDRLRTDAARLEREIFRDHPNLSGLVVGEKSGGQPENWLAENETLLEFFDEKTCFNLFVKSRDKLLFWKKIPKDVAFLTLLEKFKSYFANASAISNDPAGYLKTAFELYQKLVPPEIAKAENLVVAPDGAICFIPFEALLTAPASSASLRAAPFLIKKQSVRYIWSLATQDFQQKIRPGARGLFLGIAPGFQQKERGLAPLAGGATEWAGLSGTTVLLEKNATRAAFLAQSGDFRIVHLSTHASAEGLPRIEFIDQAALLPDIYAAPLRAELVVLSACETGLGAEAKGEGVMSLSRAFACAGARSLVASLWNANDRSTTAIFAAFYENLKLGRTKSASLRQAKLDYLAADGPDALKSPWFWAAFTMSGADGKVEMAHGFAAPTVGFLVAGLFLLGLIFFWKKANSKSPTGGP